ncbi:MAG: hypothetical protein Q9195_000254 [Heterodermia aff. obscurata]
MEKKLRGGKTAPKLLGDLLLYDPPNQKGLFNNLVDIPKFEDEQWTVDPTPPRKCCYHKWMLDEDHTTLIQARAEQAIASDPDRFEGYPIPTGAEVLSNLQTYLHSGLHSSEPKVINGANKRWLLSLGESCKELLEYLGFEKQVICMLICTLPINNSNQGIDWVRPAPGPVTTPLLVESLHNRLNHVEKEILILLSKRSNEERKAIKIDVASESPLAALRKLLGTTKYKIKLGWQPTGPAEEDHPFYAGLGVVGDFHDELIIFAYDRQIATDPDNLAYYLECLQGICDGRDGPPDLQTKVLLEQTADKVSGRDLRSAYRKLGVNSSLPDETILGTFQARLLDAPSHQEEELREALKMVGIYRKSKRLREAASMEVKTYEQALAFLNVAEDFADDAVVAMQFTKVFFDQVHDNFSDEPRARKAVQLIAEHRNSNALRAWCTTGELGEVEMDIGHAYNRLEISDRTVDDELVLVAFNTYALETPSQLDDLRKALKAIAISRNSRTLLNELGINETLEKHSPSEWPVGLENIGNTCYLNSLLQCYFTVRPLRELVSNFEDYRMPVDAQSLASKQVGSRQVSRLEVERAQKFSVELRRLFENMITATKSEVRPEQELARLTLMSSTTEEQVRRRSTLRGPRPSLGEINGEAVLGPLPPFSNQAGQTDFEIIDHPVANDKPAPTFDGVTSADDSSSVTLIDVSIPGQEDVEMDGIEGVKGVQQNILDNKENLPPTKEDSARLATQDIDLVALGDASPSRANRQLRTLSPVREGEINEHHVDLKATLPQPNRPPPVPPRPEQETKVSIQEQLEIGAQQDVTEVIGNVLFQLQCAIKPENLDANGEQIDMVKRLFYGKLKSITTNQAGATRSNEAFFSDIKVNVFSDPPPADIYAALDGAFDQQEVEVGGAVEPQYTTISLLPPILQIHINRADFDREKQTNVKSNHLFDFTDTLYMDRYTDLADAELIERRDQKWAWKKELSDLEGHKNVPEASAPEDIGHLRGWLEQVNEPGDENPLPVSQRLLEKLKDEEVRLKEEARINASRIKDLRTNIDTQFVDQRNICYRLHSVFIHRGGASSGHYWIYIYDFERKFWRKYNDGYVTKVNETEVFGHDPLIPPATPYFLTYIRNGMQDQLIDCVRREPIEFVPEAIEDTVMEDVIPSVEMEHNEGMHDNVGIGYRKREYVPITEWDSSDAAELADW